MRARTRRWAPFALIAALLAALAGCTYLKHEVKTETLRTWTETKGEDRVPFVRAEYDVPRDALKLQIGDTVTRKVEACTEREEAGDLSVKFESSTLDAFLSNDEHAFLVGLITLPFNLLVDLGGPLVALLSAPFDALAQDTRGRHVERAPAEEVVEVLWETFDLLDPAVPAARLTLTAADALALSGADLGLLGFRSASLTAVGPSGEERAVTLQSTVVEAARAWAADLARFPAELRVRVAPGESLADAVAGARTGSWIQLEAGVYDVPDAISLWGRELVVAGRGSGRTTLRCRGSAAFALEGGHRVMLVGLGIVLEGAGPSVGVSTSDGALVVARCTIAGARAGMVSAPLGPVSGGGRGVECQGSGSTALEGSRVEGETHGVLAWGTHVVTLDLCEVVGGEVAAVMLYERATGKVGRSVITGRRDGVQLFEDASVEVTECQVSVPRVGVYVISRQSCGVTSTVIEGCSIGLCLEGTSSNGTYGTNTLRRNKVGIQVQAEGDAIRIVGNQVRDSLEAAIGVGGKAKPSVEGNTCEGGPVGLYYGEQAGGMADKNTLVRNKVGAMLDGSTTAAIRFCDVTDNSGAGLILRGQSKSAVLHCKLLRNAVGMAFETSEMTTVNSNEITGNEVGLVISGDVLHRFDDNQITDNSGPGIVLMGDAQFNMVYRNIIGGNNPNVTRR